MRDTVVVRQLVSAGFWVSPGLPLVGIPLISTAVEKSFGPTSAVMATANLLHASLRGFWARRLFMNEFRVA